MNNEMILPLLALLFSVIIFIFPLSFLLLPRLEKKNKNLTIILLYIIELIIFIILFKTFYNEITYHFLSNNNLESQTSSINSHTMTNINNYMFLMHTFHIYPSLIMVIIAFIKTIIYHKNNSNKLDFVGLIIMASYLCMPWFTWFTSPDF